MCDFYRLEVHSEDLYLYVQTYSYYTSSDSSYGDVADNTWHHICTAGKFQNVDRSVEVSFLRNFSFSKLPITDV